MRISKKFYTKSPTKYVFLGLTINLYEKKLFPLQFRGGILGQEYQIYRYYLLCKKFFSLFYTFLKLMIIIAIDIFFESNLLKIYFIFKFFITFSWLMISYINILDNP